LAWASPDVGRAGTVHLGGSFAEIAFTEREINAGRMPDRPFVLVGQQYLADPQRSAGDIHPVYSYAHVPHGYAGDATAAIIALVLGPRATLSPYDLGIPGMYLCSAATPPGPGAHGLCGANAAGQALRYLRRQGAA
jgi:phytoene dehydrogenase-like protein